MNIILIAIILISNLIDGNSYTASAYCISGRTASGVKAGRGMVAADPKLHKLGSKIRVKSSRGTQILQVTDTGKNIKMRRLDLWMPCQEAIRFGKQRVKVEKL
jgi:3D (Asp-Asp-Asp) domain-containing protein